MKPIDCYVIGKLYKRYVQMVKKTIAGEKYVSKSLMFDIPEPYDLVMDQLKAPARALYQYILCVLAGLEPLYYDKDCWEFEYFYALHERVNLRVHDMYDSLDLVNKTSY
jgi:hypothetical protein